MAVSVIFQFQHAYFVPAQATHEDCSPKRRLSKASTHSPLYESPGYRWANFLITSPPIRNYS